MPDARLAVPPLVAVTQSLRPVELHQPLPQPVVLRREVHTLDLRVACRLVDRHVEDTEMQHPQPEQRAVHVLRSHQALDHLVRDLLRRRGVPLGLLFPGGERRGRERRVVPAQRFQRRRRPAPVLEHLARGFAEVDHRFGAVEARVERPRHEVVDAVAQFVEESYELWVRKEAGFLGGGLGKVAHQCCSGIVTGSVLANESLDGIRLDSKDSRG